MSDDAAWKPIFTLPPPGERQGKVWVLVEGEETHSGSRWRRRSAGIARTNNVGFENDDIRTIEKLDNASPVSITRFLA